MESIVPEPMQSFYDRFHFSPAMVHNGIAMISGVTGMRADGTCAADAEEQARDLFTTMGLVLEAAGLGFGDVLEMTSYHVDMAEMGAFMKVKDEFCTEPWPAWTAVGTTGLVLPDARFEVRVTARTPTGS